MDHPEDEAIFAINRPHPNLRFWYLFTSFLWGPLFPIPMFFQWRRYVTIQYRFDQQGITVSWGKLARREINVLYERIQDIHLKVNFVERKLGLARLAIQTASGDASAEITLIGLQEYEAIQRFLHRRTRHQATTTPQPATENTAALADVLNRVTDELRGLRQDLEQSRASVAEENEEVVAEAAPLAESAPVEGEPS